MDQYLETTPLLADDDSRPDQRRLYGAYILVLLLLAPAIAAWIISGQYDQDTSTCNDGTHYRLELPIFLNLVSVVHIAHAIGRVVYDLTVYCLEQKVYADHEWGLALVFTFDCAFVVVGLMMYTEQMSTECRAQDIGIMIFAWCLCVCAFVALGCSAFCCAIILTLIL